MQKELSGEECQQEQKGDTAQRRWMRDRCHWKCTSSLPHVQAQIEDKDDLCTISIPFFGDS